MLGLWALLPPSIPGAALLRASYDGYFTWLGAATELPHESPVVIVYLDLESHLRERQNPALPWPRDLHARLLRRLAAAGTRAVVYDIVFDQDGPDPGGDRAFQEAIREHGKVVLAAELSVSSLGIGEGAWGRTTRLALPATSFRNGAAAWGLGELRVDDDFVCRRFFAGWLSDTEPVPSLAWATAGILGMVKPGADPVAAERYWLRYYGPPFTVPHVSFSSALDPRLVDDSAFRDKIVFVGARPMAGAFLERRDEFRSPFRTWRDRDPFVPGVEIHAIQFLNLWYGDGLRRLSIGWEAMVVLGAGLLLGGGLIQLRPIRAILATVVITIALLATACITFRQSQVWFPWLLVVGAQIPAGLGGTILFHSAEWYRARRRLEAARRVAEARIREQARLIECAHDAILVQDLQGVVTYANPSCERLYGWSTKELLAGAATNLLACEGADEARRVALASGEWQGELRQTTRTGSTRIVESHWTLLTDETAQPTGILLINTDISERKRLEAETLRMQRMEAIGALASGMAHDLNNALAPVLMGVQRLRLGTHDQDAQRILNLMENSTRRGAEMIRQVLQFARGRQGDFEPIPLQPLIKEVERLIRETFPKNVRVSTEVSSALWTVRGNATQLHQVLLNLAVNARDAMPKGGSLAFVADNVTLHTHNLPPHSDATPGEYVVLMISDTGCGMAPELQAKIFDPFFTTKPEGKGTGLGLSTTTRIVKAHDGFLVVQSAPGEGSTFEVYLPRLADTPARTDVPASAPCAHGQGELILVAADDAAVRELVVHGLMDLNYRVISAANGAEAVSLHRSHALEVALAILDIDMQLLSGDQALAAMRQLASGLPAIFLSGGSTAPRSADVEAEASGPVFVLRKPFAWDELVQCVGRGLK